MKKTILFSMIFLVICIPLVSAGFWDIFMPAIAGSAYQTAANTDGARQTVTCYFQDSDEVHKCISSKGQSCTGQGQCSMDVNVRRGGLATFKADCGAAPTTNRFFGRDRNIIFRCPTEGEDGGLVERIMRNDRDTTSHRRSTTRTYGDNSYKTDAPPLYDDVLSHPQPDPNGDGEEGEYYKSDAGNKQVDETVSAWRARMQQKYSSEKSDQTEDTNADGERMPPMPPTQAWTECMDSSAGDDCNEVCSSQGKMFSNSCTTSKGFRNWGVEAWKDQNCQGEGVGQSRHGDLTLVSSVNWKCCCK
ncbi:MAG: hypothetical protein KKG59_07635 [Nanoarchaeota archaeon]|nr:hypothetical protein [Nanoarchaeota archaeon]